MRRPGLVGNIGALQWPRVHGRPARPHGRSPARVVAVGEPAAALGRWADSTGLVVMSRDAIVIRDAGPADATAVVALLTELGHPVDAAALPARLTAVQQDGGAALLAVEAGGAPLGLLTLAAHAVLHAAGPVGLITALVVSAAARRRGVGRQLVEAAKRWARDRGCVRLVVTSAERRRDAHDFYPACGLAYTGRRFATAIAPAPERTGAADAAAQTASAG